MKVKSIILALALTIPLGTVGCAKSTAPTPPVAPGYTSQADQTMGEILAAAHAFYTSVQQQTAAGTMTLSPTEKSAFNAFAATLNGAQIAYLAYHSNPTPTNLSIAQNAVNQVQTQQATLPQPKGN